MNQKIEITKYVIEKLGLKSPSERSFKAWIHVLWQNPRSKEKGGLRLTPRGFELLTNADIKYYEVRLDDNDLTFENKFILWLDSTFDCPFFISRNKIYFFNEKPAVQLVLFSGNLQNYYTAHQNFSKKVDIS